MADREKVISAIEKAKEQSEEYGLDRILVDFKAADMILELLKEQEAIESINFGDRTEIMANLEGLTWDDWRMYHSDTEVQNIAKSAFYLLIALLKEQEAQPVKAVKNAYNHEFYYCPKCGRSFYETWLKKPKFCDECGQAVIFK